MNEKKSSQSQMMCCDAPESTRQDDSEQLPTFNTNSELKVGIAPPEILGYVNFIELIEYITRFSPSELSFNSTTKSSLKYPTGYNSESSTISS